MGCGCDAKGLMPIEKAKQIIWDTITPIDDVDQCNLDSALDRVLAEDVISPINVPGFDNSAMDGYAIRHQDLSSGTTFSLVGKSFAGNPFSGEIGKHQCVRIMTGAQIPSGADAVVMQENTVANGKEITVTHTVKLGEAIRIAGSDIAKKSVVLSKGKRLTAIDIGLLASIGIDKASVFRKLKVALFSTGDELLQPGDIPQQGKIFDSNRPMLRAMLKRLGAEVLDLGVIEDDPEKIRDAFTQADASADCVITSGGVSVGEADYTREILEEIGQVDFWKLAIKPGKPLAFGRLNNSLFFGLPGNPVSAAVTFDQIAAPSLSLLAGCTPKENVAIRAIAKNRFRKKPGRTDYQRAFCYRDDNGQLIVDSGGSQSSGVLSCFTTSNCYAVLENGRGMVEPGETVNVQWFDSVLR
ncbi:MAG: molybdopterin molybdotransferase MoeA [Pseudomonadota bacterium]